MPASHTLLHTTRECNGRPLGAIIFLASNLVRLTLTVGSQIAWGLQFKTMDKRPSFSNYVERLTARPAMVQAQELDDKLVGNTTVVSPAIP